MAIPEPPTTPPPPLVDELEPIPTDPPPPYPTRERRSRPARTHRGTHGRIQTTNIPPHHLHHTQSLSSGSHIDSDSPLSPYTDDDSEPTETTPIFPRHHHHHGGRPRAQSYTSTTSSLTHTVLSIFQTEEDDSSEGSTRFSMGNDGVSVRSSQRGTGFFSVAAWRRYFRPLSVKSYYWALFHLLVVNFPFGLVAWIYLFVFTVVRTTCSSHSAAVSLMTRRRGRSCL